MRTLTRYITRIFLSHLIVMLVAFVALLQLLDLLNNAEDIIRRHGDSPLVITRYAVLRLPELITFLLPFSVLMASLLSLAKLSQSNEITALKASGLSFYRTLFAFLPAVCIIAGIHFLLSDQVAPQTSRALSQWDAEAEANGNIPEDSQGSGLWTRDGSTLVRVSGVADQGRKLWGITLFQRDSGGNLVDRVTAITATYERGGWQLADVEQLAITSGTGGEFTRAPSLRWESSLTPRHFADLSAPPSTLSLLELIAFVTNPEVGNRPLYFYETWLHKRVALPVASMLMVLLAAPVAQGLQRHRGVGLGLAVGVGLGFLYFVTDGLVLALGEAGAIPPALAAWAPSLLFASIGALALIRIEGYR